MQPILERQFERLHEQLGRLREKIRDQQSAINRLHEEKQKGLEEQLERQRYYTALAAKERDFDAVEAERDALRAREGALREHLDRLMKLTKALQEAFRG